MTITTTRELGPIKSKEKRKHPEKKHSGRISRMKRFLSSMLLGGTIALSGCMSYQIGSEDAGARDSIARHDSAKDSAGDAKLCYFEPSSENVLDFNILLYQAHHTQGI